MSDVWCNRGHSGLSHGRQNLTEGQGPIHSVNTLRDDEEDSVRREG